MHRWINVSHAVKCTFPIIQQFLAFLLISFLKVEHSNLHSDVKDRFLNSKFFSRPKLLNHPIEITNRSLFLGILPRYYYRKMCKFEQIDFGLKISDEIMVQLNQSIASLKYKLVISTRKVSTFKRETRVGPYNALQLSTLYNLLIPLNIAKSN